MAPFSVDGMEQVNPTLFGSEPAAQQAGYECYVDEAKAIDVTDLLQQDTWAEWPQLSEDQSLAARQAVASCLEAGDYRAKWIGIHVWGWNTYARNGETQPVLTIDDPCFAPIFASPEAFVAKVVEVGHFPNSVIGPFDCRASTAPTSPTPVPTPPSHPWYECEVFDYALIGVDYRVTNIAADDPDGGLVAHVAPGMDAAVTAVMPDGTGELRIWGCQQNPSSSSVWWQIETKGWVNSSFLEAHVPFGAEDWIPGMTNPIDPANLPAVIGLEGEDLPALAEAVRNVLDSEAAPVVELGNFIGVDALGGIARLDITGLADDSLNGYRLELTIDLIKDDTATDILGYRIVSAIGRAICRRGVNEDGNLCV